MIESRSESGIFMTKRRKNRASSALPNCRRLLAVVGCVGLEVVLGDGYSSST